MDLTYEIPEETLQDAIYLVNGLFAPLSGFMGQADYQSVVWNMTLSDGDIWTIPITLDVPQDIYNAVERQPEVILTYRQKPVVQMTVRSRFMVTQEELIHVFATDDLRHPGLAKELRRHRYRVGGAVTLLDDALLSEALAPEKTKAIFVQKGFKTVAGFQTRNAIHKAHEHLQRTALEVCDGLFINPLIGWKKSGDFTQDAVKIAYQTMTEQFYPAEKVHLDFLKTQMRYAGPREAIFHAIIRRNLGCTHFIIGRDHAGVGGYYGNYDAHQLAQEIQQKGDLGINLLLLREPYYCKRCGQIVTDKHCVHKEADKIHISGTMIRQCLSSGQIPDQRMMRPEIAQALIGLGKDHIFIP